MATFVNLINSSQLKCRIAESRRRYAMLIQKWQFGMDCCRAVKVVFDAALERLEAGTYGVCTGCGGAIPFERLFVFPETPECASCG